jgi:hypothetical protein
VSIEPGKPLNDASHDPLTLQSAKYLKAGDQPWEFDGGPGWHEIATGLRLAARGYGVLIVGSIVGLVFLWLALSVRAPFGLNIDDDDRDAFLVVAVLTFGMTGLCSYGLVLSGQWRCLMYAPPRHSAKELMYICVNCLLIGFGLNVFGIYLEGGKTYTALQRGWAGLDELDRWSPGNLMQMSSVLLGVIGSLVFSQFLRSVADCVQARRRARAVDFNLWFMGLLIGGSLGVHFFVHRLSLKADALPWLIGGWLLCFAWHLWLVLSVRRCVVDGLRRVSSSSAGRAAPEVAPSTVPLSTLSGVHRLLRDTGA